MSAIAPGPCARMLALLGAFAVACQAAQRPSQSSQVRSQAVEASAGIWADTANTMSDARQYHGAAALDSGRVLVCGGRSTLDSAMELSSCDVFTSATGAFSAAPALAGPRAFLTLTQVGDGLVYAIGGQEPLFTPNYHADVWRFSVEDGAVKRAAAESLKTGRVRHTASWLPAARALAVIGGRNGDDLVSDELSRVDGNGNALGFNKVDPPSLRTGHTATVLASGKDLLVLGGRGDDVIRSVRLLTVPESGSPSWTELSELAEGGLSEHTATLLEDGRVLVAGGRSLPAGTSLASSFIYDVANGGKLVAIAAEMSSPRREHAAALLAHRVVVTGGLTSADAATASVEVFDPSRKTWFPLDAMKRARYGHTITVLDEHRLLVSGGLVDGKSSATAEVLSVRLQGEPCAAGQHQCITGYCVDGVCCDSACDGACSRCDARGHAGECRSDVSGDPVGARSCGGGLACSDGECRESCETHDDCVSTHFCSDGSCKPRLPLKAACSDSRECGGGAPCVDGYCCDSPCAGKCEACGEPGSLGKCVPVSGAPRGERDGCGEPSGDCGLSCDGEDREECHFREPGAVCGVNSCQDALLRTPAQCDGIGNCTDSPAPCPGGLACAADGVSCLSACTSDADCADNGHKCSTETAPAVCVAKPGLGKRCAAASECSDGLRCVDERCCADECPDASWSCALPGHEGECRKRTGESCEADSQCGSDFCVLGVCCESACSGQCETCSAEGHRGECRPQLGQPEPGRRPCESDEDDWCGARSCDGVDQASHRESCQGYANDEAPCEDARCSDNSFIPERRCSKGVCVAAKAQDCALYSCTMSGCNTECGRDDDCSGSATCQDGACKPAKPQCVDNRLVTPGAPPTSCGGYRCVGDRCLTRCEDSRECADDFVCDDETHRCLRLEAPITSSAAPSDDGCQCALPGRAAPGRRPLAALAALLCAAGALRRRAARRPAPLPGAAR